MMREPTMEVASTKDSPLRSSPFSSPNVASLLKIKIISWSQETGLPVSVKVRVADKTFNLHKCPLFTKSGYFRKRLEDSEEIELPPAFPGGADTFEIIVLFIYGSSALIDAFNVAALRCAADFLEMTEEYSPSNLCDRFDLFLNHVVLQSWDDTLIVLHKCQTLLPLTEELLIVSRCIETLAFMACMEILDPERRRDRPVVSLEALASQGWRCDAVKEIVSQDLWIRDLIALPCEFFKRVMTSLRRQGMREKYVSPIIVFYANKWVLSEKTRQFWECSGGEVSNDGTNGKVLSTILQGVLDLLPMGEKTSRVIPVGFYFGLLAKAIEVDLGSDSLSKLQDQVASLLHTAQVEDFLLPRKGGENPIYSSKEVATMENIFSTHVSFYMEINRTPSRSNIVVAELWDAYLAHVAPDPDMGSKQFMDLIETVPPSCRQRHDHLYTAIDSFLQAHPGISQEEKGSICKYLSCQKLSQKACMDAVQNELMPLRLIVQALFVQQMNTHQAFKECSESFRYAHCGDFSGSLPSSIYPNSRSQKLGDISCVDEESDSRTLSFLLQKDLPVQKPEFSKKDFESASFRIQSLEQELIALKKTLQWQSTTSKGPEPASTKSKSLKNPRSLEGKALSGKGNNPLGQMSACIGSINVTTQRKCASGILKVFQKISLFAKGKPKKKPGFSDL